MRIVFLGTPETAVPTLDALTDAGHEIARVVTQPDRPSGRSGAPKASPVKERALAAGLPVLQPARVRTPEFAAAIAEAKPDVLVVVAYGRILVPEVLRTSPLGAVNAHFSLLPRYRGAAPVAWALVHGERETGVTTFRLDEGLDTGAILAARATAIAPREHAPALLARLAREGAALLVETLAGLETGAIVPRPQDESAASAAPLLTREDGAWNPGWTAREVEGRVRGLDPWPGVWALCGGRRIRLVEVEAIDGTATGAGTGAILDRSGAGLVIACDGGTLARIDAVQAEGRRAVSAREAIGGRLLRPGDRLERPTT